jgi:hypothetical protein
MRQFEILTFPGEAHIVIRVLSIRLSYSTPSRVLASLSIQRGSFLMAQNEPCSFSLNFVGTFCGSHRIPIKRVR